MQRDKLIKEQRQLERLGCYDDFNQIITEQHYYEALKKCRKSVSWKDSVQIYTQHAVLEIHSIAKKVRRGELPNLKRTQRIEIRERGKKRIIVPVRIDDRITQRVVCDFSLVPLLSNHIIYDNGASMEGKGVEFTRGRIERHLRKAIKKYGDNFYVLVYDFKSFFDSIPHQTCEDVLNELYNDKTVVWLIMSIIRSYERALIRTEPDVNLRKRHLDLLDNNQLSGICLGSQISQSIALIVPNELDHFIKDRCGAKQYIRYMDDGKINSESKEYLESVYAGMESIVDKLGLSFNKKKTRIIPVSKGFTFMKVKYRVSKDGKLIKSLSRAGITRMRRKLKKYRTLVSLGKMTQEDVYFSMQSWLAHAKIAPSYKSAKKMMILYRDVNGMYKNDVLTEVMKRKKKNYMVA